MDRSDGAGSRKPNPPCQARSSAIPLPPGGFPVDEMYRPTDLSAGHFDRIRECSIRRLIVGKDPESRALSLDAPVLVLVLLQHRLVGTVQFDWFLSRQFRANEESVWAVADPRDP